MKYPEFIWSQGWGSNAFLHLDNNVKLFGSLNFDFKEEFINQIGKYNVSILGDISELYI